LSEGVLLPQEMWVLLVLCSARVCWPSRPQPQRRLSVRASPEVKTALTA